MAVGASPELEASCKTPLSKYEKIYQYNALYKAFNNAMSGHRDEEKYAKYEANKIEIISNISQLLKDKTYQPEVLKEFYVYEPKKRVVHAPSIPDKIVQNALVDEVLYEDITKHFIRDTYSTIIGRGTHDGLSRLKRFAAESWRRYGTNTWVLKCDIRKFFANINKDDVLIKFDSIEDDKDIVRLVELYLGVHDKGLPLGLRTSQLLANLELNWMDHKIKEYYRCKWYGRYMDDFYIIHNDKQLLKDLRSEIGYELSLINLEFNEKTQIFPMAHGIDFLGFRTYISESGKVIQKLRRSSRKRECRRIKLFKKMYSQGLISEEEIRKSYSAWKAHASYGNCYGLIKDFDKRIDNIF